MDLINRLSQFQHRVPNYTSIKGQKCTLAFLSTTGNQIYMYIHLLISLEVIRMETHVHVPGQ